MFLLGASLLPFISLAWGDEVPEVGIGAVHPICDSLVSECISSDEQVQDDLVAELEADEQITGEPAFRSSVFVVVPAQYSVPSPDYGAFFHVRGNVDLIIIPGSRRLSISSVHLTLVFSHTSHWHR